MRKTFHFLFVLLASLQLIGGPYSVAQVVAWSTMLVDYSKEGSVLQAAKDTFSGERPCALCRKIRLAESANGDEKSPTQLPSSHSIKQLKEMLPNKELALPLPKVLLVAFRTFCVASLCHGIAADAPPVPPPCRAA